MIIRWNHFEKNQVSNSIDANYHMISLYHMMTHSRLKFCIIYRNVLFSSNKIRVNIFHSNFHVINRAFTKFFKLINIISWRNLYEKKKTNVRFDWRTNYHNYLSQIFINDIFILIRFDYDTIISINIDIYIIYTYRYKFEFRV